MENVLMKDEDTEGVLGEDRVQVTSRGQDYLDQRS